jgi:hypothetical protein
MTAEEPLSPYVFGLAKAHPEIAMAVNLRYLGSPANTCSNLLTLIGGKVMYQPIWD